MTPAFPHALPLVGRNTLLARCLQSLQDDRVVTLVGPGGVGKTRLALELHQRTRANRDVYFVDLSSSSSHAEVINAVARTLGPGLSPDGVELVLKGRGPRIAPLIILDNAEQAREAVREVCADWVARHDKLRMLVTSRHALELAAERVIEVPPLDTASPGQSEAVQCFLQAISPDAAIGEVDDLTNVRTIVQKLDGLPLALELAAARLSVMSVGQLVQRLHDLVPVLVDPSRAGARHGALTSLLEHSWQLLPPPDRQAFAQLSLFVAPFDLKEAELVLQIDGSTVMDALHRLRRHHLVARRDGGKLYMLSTIRAYATLRFDQLDDALTAKRRFVHAFARRCQGCLDGDTLQADLDAVSDSVDHLEAALKHALGLDMVEQAVHIAGALGTYYCAHGPMVRAQQMVRPVLDRGIPSRDAGWLWSSLAYSHRSMGEVDQAIATYVTMAELAEVEGDDALAWRAASGRAVLLSSTRDPRASLVFYERAEQAARRAGLNGRLGNTLANHALALHDAGGGDKLQALIAEAITLARASGHAGSLARTLQSVGSIHMDHGDVVHAIELYTEAHALVLASHDQRRVGSIECFLAFGQQCLGDDHKAAELYRSALQRMRLAGEENFSWVIRGMIAAIPADGAALDDAILELRAVVEELRLTGERRMMVSFWSCLIEGLAISGRRREARAELTSLRALHAQENSTRCAEVYVALYASDDRQARRHAVQRGRELAQSMFKKPGQFVTLRRLNRRLDAVERLASGWRVHTHGAWFESPTGVPVSLDRRVKPKTILGALVRCHQDAVNQTLSVSELASAAWPGEQMTPSSARNRVRVAISTLRKAGLADLLQHHDHGYRLDPSQAISVERSDELPRARN